MKRKLAVFGACAGLCLGVVVSRVLFDGRRALSRGDRAMQGGDPAQAIDWWRRAARWYLPGAPHVGRSYTRLEELARAAEAGDTALCTDAAACRQLAIDAWTAIRSSSRATESFYRPHRAGEARASERLAELMAKEEQALALRPELSEEEKRSWHLALLRREHAPSVPWTLFALVGLAAWIGGGFWFAWRGVTAEDRLDRRAAAQAGALVLVGLVVWMLGLYRA